MRNSISGTSEALHILEDPDVQGLLSSDYATLAMLRPLAEENIDPYLLVGSAHDTLERSINPVLSVYKKFFFTFDEQMVDNFYEGTSKQDQLVKPAEHYTHLPSRWHEFVHVMTAGTTTGLILYSPRGNAVNLWRRQIGHWDVEGHRNTETLRGRFALKNFNNLIHGSDSPKSAVREIAIIVEGLRRQLSQDE